MFGQRGTVPGQTMGNAADKHGVSYCQFLLYCLAALLKLGLKQQTAPHTLSAKCDARLGWTQLNTHYHAQINA